MAAVPGARPPRRLWSPRTPPARPRPGLCGAGERVEAAVPVPATCAPASPWPAVPLHGPRWPLACGAPACVAWPVRARCPLEHRWPGIRELGLACPPIAARAGRRVSGGSGAPRLRQIRGGAAPADPRRRGSGGSAGRGARHAGSGRRQTRCGADAAGGR